MRVEPFPDGSGDVEVELRGVRRARIERQPFNENGTAMVRDRQSRRRRLRASSASLPPPYSHHPPIHLTRLFLPVRVSTSRPFT